MPGDLGVTNDCLQTREHMYGTHVLVINKLVLFDLLWSLYVVPFFQLRELFMKYETIDMYITLNNITY